MKDKRFDTFQMMCPVISTPTPSRPHSPRKAHGRRFSAAFDKFSWLHRGFVAFRALPQ